MSPNRLGEETPKTAWDRTDRDDPPFTVADIAGHTGTHGQTIGGWIHSGELTAKTFGARIGRRIRRADYDEFLRRRQLSGAIARPLLTLGSHALDPPPEIVPVVAAIALTRSSFGRPSMDAEHFDRFVRSRCPRSSG